MKSILTQVLTAYGINNHVSLSLFLIIKRPFAIDIIIISMRKVVYICVVKTL